MLRSIAFLIVAGILLGGSLGAPFTRDEVSFNAIRSRDFTAIAVTRESGPASAAPLVVRVHLIGDAAGADISEPAAWLRDHANIVVLPAKDGAPLFLTALDLSATSGRATLGATIDTGMAVEVTDARIAPCVVTHELLHFVGLAHVSDPRNIMFPQCTRDRLREATLTPEQRARVDAVSEMLATTPAGVVQWATRG